MQNSKPEVVAALGRALDPDRVHFVAPDDEADLPCISYLELNNVPISADDKEYLSAVDIAVDIWGEVGRTKPEEITSIARAVDRELCAIGGRRTHCTDIPPDGTHTLHKNMIYEFLFGEDE